MATWEVLYQTSPFTRSNEKILFVAAEDRSDAFVTAFDYLAHKGVQVEVHRDDLESMNLNRIKILSRIGSYRAGSARIRGIAPHSYQLKGKVFDPEQRRDDSVLPPKRPKAMLEPLSK